MTCRCHADDSLYGGLLDCPRCGHRSYEQMPSGWGACERRKYGYETQAGQSTQASLFDAPT